MTQVRALLMAAEGRRLRLLVPMVVDVAELARVRELLARAGDGGVADVQLGVMVETPAAA